MSVQALSCAMVMRGVSSSEKLLLLVLANYADDKMTCWPSHKRLADDTSLSQRTVLNLLKGLEERRIISRSERQRPDGSRTSDIITLHFSGEVVSPPPEAISPRGETSAVGVGKSVQGGGEMASPLTSFEPSTNLSDDIDWSARLDEATRIAGDGLDRTSTGLMHAKDLRALCEPSSGEPCTWDEVVDAVRMCAARAKTRGKPMRSWSWVKEDALALRDKRLTSANPEPRQAHERPHHQQQSTARTDRLGRSLAGLMAAVDEREPALGGRDPRPG